MRVTRTEIQKPFPPQLPHNTIVLYLKKSTAFLCPLKGKALEQGTKDRWGGPLQELLVRTAYVLTQALLDHLGASAPSRQQGMPLPSSSHSNPSFLPFFFSSSKALLCSAQFPEETHLLCISPILNPGSLCFKFF